MHTQISPFMPFHSTRPTAGEEHNTSATHVAQLHHDRKHTCNAEARRNTRSTDKDHIKTPKSMFRMHTQIPPFMPFRSTRPTDSTGDSSSLRPSVHVHVHDSMQQTTKKNIIPIINGDIIFPRNIPNLNQSLLKGVKILEFNIPKTRNIKEIIVDQTLNSPL